MTGANPFEPAHGTNQTEAPEPADDSEFGQNKRTPHAWVSSTYFAEGFPYSVVNKLAEVLFKELGASLQLIGLTALFHLPWNLKFLWGPFLDAYGTKRGWLILSEVILVFGMLLLALASTGSSALLFASGVFVVLAVVAATHDIAIDGFYMVALNEDDQSKFVGYRAAAYRMAMLMIGGPILILAGMAGWFVSFGACAVLMAILLAFHVWFLPRPEKAKRPMSAMGGLLCKPRVWVRLAALSAAAFGATKLWTSATGTQLRSDLITQFPALGTISLSGWIAISLLCILLVVLASLPTLKRRMDSSDSFYAKAFVDFLDQPRVGRILAFVVLFRCGESFVLKMRYPFLSDAGMSLEQYGVTSGTFGMVASFTATLIGGRLISKDGLRKWIWPFAIAQNALNLLYAGVAVLVADVPAGTETPGWVINVLQGVVVLEEAGAGFGTAVFMVYLMRCCRPGHQAAHMAIVTALMSVTFTLAGVASGFLADAMGYAPYFAFTVLAAIPAMLLIPGLPWIDGREESPAP